MRLLSVTASLSTAGSQSVSPSGMNVQDNSTVRLEALQLVSTLRQPTVTLPKSVLLRVLRPELDDIAGNNLHHTVRSCFGVTDSRVFLLDPPPSVAHDAVLSPTVITYSARATLPGSITLFEVFDPSFPAPNFASTPSRVDTTLATQCVSDSSFAVPLLADPATLGVRRAHSRELLRCFVRTPDSCPLWVFDLAPATLRPFLAISCPESLAGRFVSFALSQILQTLFDAGPGCVPILDSALCMATVGSGQSHPSSESCDNIAMIRIRNL